MPISAMTAMANPSGLPGATPHESTNISFGKVTFTMASAIAERTALILQANKIAPTFFLPERPSSAAEV